MWNISLQKPAVYDGVNFVQKNYVTTFLNDHLPLEAGGFLLHFHVCLPNASSLPPSSLWQMFTLSKFVLIEVVLPLYN